MRLALVVGARPNFMKAAPVLHALEADGRAQVSLVHTGQHYDQNMSDSFLQDLNIRPPDLMLGVGSGSHGSQTAEVLRLFEEYLLGHPTELVVVFGDVNSTLAATLAAVKLQVPVAHVEAGLRSGDRRMPEELNRRATDTLASLCFVTEPSGVTHLQTEGVEASRVHEVGNTMIDTLLRFRPQAAQQALPDDTPDEFVVMTMHRPSNVDDRETLQGILQAVEQISQQLPIVWPVHPRTRARLQEFGLMEAVEGNERVHLLPPIGYKDFLAYMTRARMILTDSGGIQEEALVLRVPVVTMRENTERPVTLDCGGNQLAGADPELILAASRVMLDKDPQSINIPPLWDGQAGTRIAPILLDFIERGGAL